MWIIRDLEQYLNLKPTLPAQILWGPRQCGKSALFSKISPEFREVTLDDLQLRQLANSDPALFFEQYSSPILIDEVQYAPPLFSQIKIKIDQMRRQSSSPPLTFRLTGSNQPLLDQNIRESLAGRAEHFRLHSLSVHEILKSLPNQNIMDILFRGGWPELYIQPDLNVVSFLGAYISAYLERDIAAQARVEKISAFTLVMKLLAGRTGQIMNFENVSNQAGVSSVTVKEWLGLIERSGLAMLLQPFSSNLNKRLIKAPKLHFLDSGLAVRLQGHLSVETMMTSPSAGHLFESLVFGEIIRTRDHHRRDWQVYYWRTKEGEEYDFIIVSDKKTLVIDAQVAIQSATPIHISPSLAKTLNSAAEVAVVTIGGERKMLNRECAQIPVRDLCAYLLETLG